MRKLVRTALTCAFVGTLVAGPAGVAAADVPAPVEGVQDAGGAAEESFDLDHLDLDHLTEAERAEVLASLVPVETGLEVGPQLPADLPAATSLLVAKGAAQSVSPMATGCWTQRWTWSPRAASGSVLYTYYHVGYWCASGTKVTAARVADAGGETRTPGWRYDGIQARGAGIAGNQGRSYSKHKFTLRVGGVSVQSPLQCGRVKGAASGGASADAVCGIY